MKIDLANLPGSLASVFMKELCELLSAIQAEWIVLLV